MNELEDFLKSKKLEQFCSVSPKQLELITEAIRRGIEFNLEQGITADGGAVTPLSPVTIKLKGNSRPFFETGQLFNSIKSKFNANTAEVFVASARANIAAKLNDGQGRIPARPFWGISEIVQREIDEILLNENNDI